MLRRLVATRDVLGRDQILCRVVSVGSIVQGEFDENTLSKDFTHPSGLPSSRRFEGMPTVATGSRIKVAIATLIGSRRRMQRSVSGFAETIFTERRRLSRRGFPNWSRRWTRANSLSRRLPSWPDHIPTHSESPCHCEKRTWLGRARNEEEPEESKETMAIEETEGRQVEPPGEGDIKTTTAPFSGSKRSLGSSRIRSTLC